MVALRNVIKSANGILDKAFKKNHDWKTIALIDHFDGKYQIKGRLIMVIWSFIKMKIAIHIKKAWF